MRRFILLLLVFTHYLTFANDVLVTGQFVIAPISSEQCEASIITTPTYGLSADCELYKMLVPFVSNIDDSSDVAQIITETQSVDEFTDIYDINGRKWTTLKPGLNIVIDKDGNRRKVLVAE